MYIKIFNKIHLIVFPFQKYDARKLQAKIKDGTVYLDTLWIMKWGTLTHCSGVTKTGKGFITR